MQKEEEQKNERKPGTPQSLPPAYNDPSVTKPTGPQNPPPPPPPEEDEEDTAKRVTTRMSKKLERQEDSDSGKAFLFFPL